MVDSKGNKITLSARALNILQGSSIAWQRPAFTFDVGLGKRLNMKEIKLVQVKEIYNKNNRYCPSFTFNKFSVWLMQ